ncbi:serine/threonine-protein kinase [Gordonia sp. 852002-51296_SCH5728562-b]|uniref:serine/threonine-protein kinase n=1 Tax=Gordonia sp. 852002-51296_SCH5728562-b TaxID=1834101 RepID=UPI0007EB8643|nr:serine/threonine-protein kinase [Gordonia sp. 852002-51296_SCH5728562-b]OBA34250.1 serine/threonine protein kinase [Gordonia sp. 852002-51296_SCH5728562-b]
MYLPGTDVAGYTIDALVGSGSSADVYRVHRGDERTPEALKVLHSDETGHTRAAGRFEREFTIASRLHHPNIVEMYTRGQMQPDAQSIRRAQVLGVPADRVPPTLWIAMQYVDGPAAIALIPSPTTEPVVPTFVRVAQQIAAAIDFAHSRDVLHRDVKPANILLTSTRPDTDALLSDFGIAQLVDDNRPLARNGRVQGSIAYASPELLQAKQLSPATDEYAFACTLTELLTGAPPFPRATAFAITNAHLRDDPPLLTRRRPWLPSALNSVFAKALAKNPADRYSTCSEFADIVARNLRDVPVPQPAAGRRPWRRT